MKKEFLIVSFIIFPVLVYGQLNNRKTDPIQYTIQIPEVQELLFVIFAISENGPKDPFLIDTSTQYYKDVISWFSTYKNNKVVKRINKQIFQKHYPIKMDACNYSFNGQNLLIRNSGYLNYSWGHKDHVKPFLRDLEEFVRVSNFRQFYAKHRVYYTTLIQQLEKYGMIEEQTAWLNQKFNKSHKKIYLYFSPLSYGKHSTNVAFLEQTGVIIIFISSPYFPLASQLNEEQKKAIITRMIFTEIDHNYVNPISDQFKKEIRKAFSNRAVWADQTLARGYPKPYDVFNEYLTWSLYLIFAESVFTNETFNFINNQVVTQMSEKRGFVEFQEFYLEAQKQFNKNNNIEELYTSLLAWSAGRNYPMD